MYFPSNTTTLLGWLDWQPPVSLPLWLALASVLALCWGVYAYRSRRLLSATRRRWTLGLMLLAGSVPLLLLLNPTWVEALPPPEGRPRVTVLVDTSASMVVADDADQGNQTRLDRAIRLAAEIVSCFDKTYETRVLTFDASARGASIEQLGQVAPGGRTDIAAAVRAAADGDRPRGQAVVMLSDGIHNAGPSRRAVAAARGAQSRGAPIFPIAVGRQFIVQNISVQTSGVSRLAFVNQPVQLSAKIVNQGYDAAPIRVELSHEGQVLETESVVVARDEAKDVAFTSTPSGAGLFRYRIRVDQLPAEATDQDNAVGLLVRVIDSPIGVLLLEGKPYWDSKFLGRNLAADPTISLESLVMLRSDRYLHRRQVFDDRAFEDAAVSADRTQKTGSADPVRATWQILANPHDVLGSSQSLQQYQIIVLGRDAEAYLDETTLTRLRSWVSTQGGSLVCARGTPQSTLSDKLGRMLPVRWTAATERRFRAQITEASLSEGWLLAEADPDPLAAMPSLVTSAEPEIRGGLPRVLARSNDSANSIPIVTYQPFGAGRTVVVEGTGMWRWALLPPEFGAAESTYANVWNGLLQWLVTRVALAPGQQRTLQSDRATFSSEEVASATLLLRDTVSTAQMPRVSLRREGDESITTVVCEPAGDQPGVFQARFGKLVPGSYRATLTEAESSDRSVTAFEVRRPFQERLALNPRTDILQSLAKESGGRVLESLDASEIASTIDKAISDGLPVETRRTPAWDRWWVLAGILGLWTAVWTVRRQSGLV